MMVQILSISLVLNLALTEVLVPQWGALTEWLAGETWRLNKCSHVNCVKILLTMDFALCPVLKVLNPANELDTTEKHENYSRPVSICGQHWAIRKNQTRSRMRNRRNDLYSFYLFVRLFSLSNSVELFAREHYLFSFINPRCRPCQYQCLSWLTVVTCTIAIDVVFPVGEHFKPDTKV